MPRPAIPLSASGAVIALAAFALAGCNGDPWTGFVYPERANKLAYVEIGVFGSLEECRTAATAAIGMEEWSDRADYECGQGCEEKLGLDGPFMCRRTER